MDHEEWRAGQESVTIQTDYHEFDVAYYVDGSGTTPTVFLHGIPTWGFLFRDVFDAAQHAIVPDLPGYGYTLHNQPGGYDRSVRAEAEYLLAFLDELGYDSVQLVGHDIGGSVALRLATLTDCVSRLVLSNAPIFDTWPIEAIATLGLPKKGKNMTYKDVDSTLRSLFTGGLYNQDRATETFLDGMVAPFLERDVSDLSRNAVSTNTNHTLELVPHHSKITAPTLLLWGVPGSGQHIGYADQFAESVETAEKRYLSDSYHWVMQERPEAYREALVAFLD
ncbi:alpha/beta hydrolase [Haloferax sp. AB510]|uniref:alpha/beta fold hydrolase n=1 Tax=Haloferax sp. AB510 TaxID=2934172 RepID=UPI00209C53E8|nr:alpha/beta hydrolase [Haloferax sp. AB510]MCO8267154.1 alpha/beta hydrolase [Haloferax sp. AB510]